MLNIMKLVVILSLLILTNARVIEQQCDGVIVHNINHEKEILKESVQSPYQLAIDFDTSTLFFSYTNTDSNDEIFKSAYFNLKTNEFGIIPGISGGFANTVDGKNHKVYLGGSDGVYHYNFETKKAEHLNGSDHNIWQMFFKDNNLYYTSYPDEHVHLYRNGEVSVVEELKYTKAMLVAADNDNNLFFSNSSGLFYYKRIKAKILKLGEYTLNGFAADINGNLYFSTPDGIYYINTKKSFVLIEQLVTMENIYGLAIEADNNIIYASESSIVRLKPTKTVCFVDEKKKIPVNDNTL